MKKALLFAVLIASPCFGQSQPWSNILVSSRATNWQLAGLPGAFTDKGGSKVETTANPWTPPVRTTQFGPTISPSGVAATDLSNITTALGNCPDGDFIGLAGGTFLIQGAVNLYQHSCTLQGVGGTATILLESGAGQVNFGLASGGGSCALTAASSYSAGSSTLICSGLSGTAPAVGNIATLNQCDSSAGCSTLPTDNGAIPFVCGDNSACDLEPPANNPGPPYHHEIQALIFTSVSNVGGTYTIGINPPLYTTNWAFANSPTLTWNAPGFNCIGCGLQDLTIQNNGVTANQLAAMDNAYASWTKGVRFVGVGPNSAYQIFTDTYVLMANNYFYPGYAFPAAIADTIIQSQTSATLVINNIGDGGTLWVGQGGNEGNVYAYNYNRDGFSPFLENTMYEHHSYSSMNLYEGNEVSDILHDNTWGSHAIDSEFRNYLPCWDAPYNLASQTYRSVGLNPYQRGMNIVGNAMGTAGKCTTYTSTSPNGTIYEIDSGDPVVATTLLRWCNASTVQQSSDTPANSGIRCVASEIPSSLSAPNAAWESPVPSNDNLPCSFFLAGYTSVTCTAHPTGGTGFSWWKVGTSCTIGSTVSCTGSKTQPFPFDGPDISGGPYVNGYAYDNPAMIAWSTLPVDTTLQHSYTVTGSNWASGTEVLSVTGLPNVQNLMGGFRLSGAAGACNPTSGLSYTGRTDNEILMTSSSQSSGTISYALAANPGANACNGSMLYPDVRQHDERVYEPDTSSSGSMTLNPTSQNFGSISLLTPSASVTFVLSNTTASTATAIAATVTGGNAGDFVVSNNGSGSCQAAGNSISTGQSCTVSVIFTPQALGARASTLSVSFTNSSFTGPLTSALSGNGIPVNVAPDQGAFLGGK